MWLSSGCHYLHNCNFKRLLSGMMIILYTAMIYSHLLASSSSSSSVSSLLSSSLMSSSLFLCLALGHRYCCMIGLASGASSRVPAPQQKRSTYVCSYLGDPDGKNQRVLAPPLSPTKHPLSTTKASRVA